MTIPRSPLTRPAIPRTPDSAYARCLDCGTDAGEPCHDSHDRPCAPCPGRVLADGASCVKRERVQRSSRDRPKPPPRKSRPPPRSTSCARCGTGIRSDGRFCDATACRAARKAQWRAANPPPPAHCLGCQCEISRRCRWCGSEACAEIRADRKRQYEATRLVRPVPCCVCGVLVPSRSSHATRPICGAIDCRRRRKRELGQEHRSRVRKRSRIAKPPEENVTTTLDA